MQEDSLKTGYLLKQREIPLCSSYDVIVVGGGSAGCTAAASAARAGANVLLIESSYSLGGMGTSGLVPCWAPFSDKEKIIYRGLAEKVLERSKALTSQVRKNDLDWVPLDPEGLKRIYDELMEEYGVTVLFGTSLCDVDAFEGTVNTVVVSNKSGLSAYSAKVFVDSTGDGDLAVWAGAEYEFGNDGGEPMPSTLCFILTNVDIYAYLYHPKYGRERGGIHPNNLNSFTHQLPEDSRFPDIIDTHLCNNIIGPGAIGFNAGHVFEVDSTNPQSVSEAMARGRRIAKQYRDALAAYFPEAFGNAYLAATAPVMGIRESRRVKGDYVLTVEDYLSKAVFEDEICRNSYYLDIHYTKEELEQKFAGNISHAKRCARYAPGESHGIPYRCLLPKGVKNVIVAGRSISCDKQVQGSIRVMPACLAMGEAAGMAAAFAAEKDCDVHKVDVARLRSELRKAGAYFL